MRSRESWFVALVAALLVSVGLSSPAEAGASEGADDEATGLLFVSSSTGGSVGGVDYRDEDVLVYDAESASWAVAFDGSDVGLATTDLDAVQVESLDPFVLHFSISTPRPIDGLGIVDDSDIVTFVGTGGDVTTGRFARGLEGADQRLTTNAEDVDAVAMVDGGFAVSTLGRAITRGLTAQREDLFTLDPKPASFFVGSDVGLSGRDLVAADIDVDTNTLIGSATRDWTINGTAGTNQDLFAIDLDSGATTLVHQAATAQLGAPIDAVDVATNLAAPAESWGEGQGGTSFTFGDAAVDEAGNVYVWGFYAEETTIGSGAQAVTLVSEGSFDIYLAKYTPGGNLLWTFSLGGPGADLGVDLAIDSDGDLRLAGQFARTVDFDPGPGRVTRRSTAQFRDSFVATYTPNGDLVNVKTTRGETFTGFIELVLDDNDAYYVGGTFTGTVDLGGGSGDGVITQGDGQSALLTKYNRNGALVWGRALQATLFAVPEVILVNSDGSLVAGVRYFGSIDMDPGPGETIFESGGSGDFVLGFFDPLGRLVEAVPYPGPGNAGLYGLDRTPDGSLVAVGWFADTLDFDPGPGDSTRTADGTDAFVFVRGPGGTLDDLLILDGEGLQLITVRVVGPDGSIYLGGTFGDTTDFDFGPGERLSSPAGQNDGFLAKYTAEYELEWVRTFGAEEGATRVERASLVDGGIVIQGTFDAPIDIDPGPGMTILPSSGNFDTYVVRLDADGNFR